MKVVSKVGGIMNDISKEELWKYLSNEQLGKLPNPNLKKEYITKRNNMVRCIINPLYMYAIRNGFDDTNFINAQTTNDMFYELRKFYGSQKFVRGNMEDIIKGSIRKK